LIVPAGANADDVAQVRAALRSQVETQAARVHGLEDQIAQKRAEAAEVAATIAKLKASLPMLAEKERLHKDLHDQGYGTTFSYLDSQQALSDARNDLNVLGQRAVQARAAQANLASQRDQVRAEYAAQILADLAKAEEKNNELTQDLVKAREKAGNTLLRAPVDGVVEQLAVHTVGGVVAPAEHLAVVVPGGRGLTVEAQLANRDVGFVRPGQDVAIKVETFTFTRYGLLHGRVIAVSRDSQAVPEAPASNGSAPAPAAGPASPAYLARIAVDQSDMQVDGRREPLIPGMAVTAEIKTGRRTIIDYLLSPLARKSNEALRER
jgi:hemolysin D